MAAPQVASQIGSGTLPYTRGILPASQRGNEPTGEGVRTGLQVVVANPEEFCAVDAFAASGLTIGTTPVQIAGPGITPLPRARKIVIQNSSLSAALGDALFVGHRENHDFLIEGFGVYGSNAGHINQIEIPLMAGTEVWARSVTNNISVRLLFY